ncbi:MAG: outer membrane protein assembly factor BamA [Candidatus Eisenbacteria bacterium]
MRHLAHILLVLCIVTAFAAGPHAEASEKWTVASVSFEGNHSITEKELKGLLVIRPSRFLYPSPYHPTVLENDIKSVERFYKRQGYLQAAVDGYDVDMDSTSNEVRIRIRISEGALTRVERITVFGNRAFPDDLLLEKTAVRAGDALKAKSIDSAVTGIMTMYADRGYIEAEVRPDIQTNPETNLAIVDLLIKESDQFRIADVRIDTLRKTKKSVVLRELSLKPGDVIKYSEILRSQRRLYMTGLFQSVFIRPQVPSSGDSATKDILIEVVEQQSMEFTAGIGYGTEERLRGSTEISNSNIAGTAMKAGVVCEASLIRRGVEMSFTEPRTLGSRVRSDLNMSYAYLDEPGYELERKAAKISLGRALRERSRASLGFKYTDDNLVQVDVAEVPEDLRANLRSLGLSLIHDTRNVLSNPTSGIYLELNGELTGVIFGGTNSFARSSFQMRYFRCLTSTTTLASAFEAGWMDRLRGTEEIPLGERFYAGGPNSLRGFRYQHAGPLDRRGTPVGGLFKSVLNLVEVRQDVYRMIGLVLFVDIGNVWYHIQSFHPRDYRISVGTGLRINTPIGILRGDLGVNLDPRNGEPGTRFHFSVGQAF